MSATNATPHLLLNQSEKLPKKREYMLVYAVPRVRLCARACMICIYVKSILSRSIPFAKAIHSLFTSDVSQNQIEMSLAHMKRQAVCVCVCAYWCIVTAAGNSGRNEKDSRAVAHSSGQPEITLMHRCCDTRCDSCVMHAEAYQCH